MAQTRISHFKTPKLDQVKPLPGGACPELWALLYFMVATSKPLDWSRHVGSWWGKELWHWSRCKRVWGGNPSREPPPECVHLSKAQRFSSQEAGLKKTNRLNPPCIWPLRFLWLQRNFRKQEKRKKKKEGERDLRRAAACFYFSWIIAHFLWSSADFVPQCVTVNLSIFPSPAMGVHFTLPFFLHNPTPHSPTTSPLTRPASCESFSL